MKKIVIAIILILALSPASALAKWKVAFIAQREVINAETGELGYKLGPSDYILHTSEVFHITKQGNNYFFMYFSATKSQVLTSYEWNEFRGVGETIADCYKDILARVAVGMGSGTLNEVKYMIRAHYKVDDEWTSGTIHDFEAAGSPEPCYFTNLIDLYGVE